MENNEQTNLPAATVAKDASSSKGKAAKDKSCKKVQAPSTKGGSGKPPKKGMSTHADLSTAPVVTLTVAGQPVRRGQQALIGRSGDIVVDNPHVSSLHARIRVDEDGKVYLRDLGSTNGTFLNGIRLMPEQGEVLASKADEFSLGPHVIPVKEELRATYGLLLGNGRIILQAGEEIQIGRDKHGMHNRFISAEHASVGQDETGIYIVESPAKPSSNGTFLNGEKIQPGKKYYLRPTDEVRLGNPTKAAGGRPLGDWLHLERIPSLSVPKISASRLPEERTALQTAMQVSNLYGRSHLMSGPLPDGWQYGGAGNLFDMEGSFVDGGIGRQVLVVNRRRDPVLISVLKEATKKFANQPPQRRAQAITAYVNQLFQPASMSDACLDSWYQAFAKAHPGERLYLGEYIRQGKGICIHKAVLYKLIADELRLQTTLVRGSGDAANRLRMNHLWLEVQVSTGVQQVYDPDFNIKGARYEQIVAHAPGPLIEHELATACAGPSGGRPPEMAVRPADVVVEGQILVVSESGTPIGRYHKAIIDRSHKGYSKVSCNHVVLRRRQDGRLYIRDISSSGTWVNGRKIPRRQDIPIDFDDDVRFGSHNGPRLNLNCRLKEPADIFIDDRRLSIDRGKEVLIGRGHPLLDPSSPNYEGVSTEHAYLLRDEDERLYIVDKSRNGTFVNGDLIPRGERFPIGPHDVVRLGCQHGPELVARTLLAVVAESGTADGGKEATTEHDRASASITIAGQELMIQPGEEVPLGRSHQNIEETEVSRTHAFAGYDADGLYIRDNSSRNGTWIKVQGTSTFERLPVGKKVYFQPADEIRLGGPTVLPLENVIVHQLARESS